MQISHSNRRCPGLPLGATTARAGLRCGAGLACLLAITWLLLPAHPVRARADWQQKVAYRMQAQLDTVARRLEASLELTYTNHSPDTLRKIYLLVPSNAFHDEENTAMREMRRFSNDDIDFEIGRGWPIVVQGVQFLSVGADSDFPLQAYNFGDTILELPLPTPLRPADSLRLQVGFYQDFTPDGNKTGSGELPADHILWFPRVAVYDQAGWHAEPFHFMMQPSDIYSEFADFDVTLTVPGNFVVAGSGEVVTGDPGWESVRADTTWSDSAFAAWYDSTRTLLRGNRQHRRVRFVTRDQHDFTWSASESLSYFEHEYNGTRFDLFAKGDDGIAWARGMLRRLNTSWRFLIQRFGDYPRSALALVAGSRRGYAQPGLVFLDGDDSFEFGYETSAVFVPGLVSTNGVKEAWIANGLQMYMGKALAEHVHGPLGYERKKAQEDMNWLERQYPLPSIDALLRNLTHLYSQSGQNEAISKKIDAYHDPIGLLFNVYVKADLFYEMLHYVVGDSAFDAALHTLLQDHRHEHIDESDLRQVFEQSSGQALNWFFDQWLRTTPVVDYKKGSVVKRKRADGTWVTEVEIERKGDGVMPVDVMVKLDDGEIVTRRWNGQAKRTTLAIETAQEPKEVVVDPDDRIMDANPLNNRKRRLEFRPDLPLLKFVHMPSDAYLVLWRPLLGYNQHDGVRLGVRTSSSYRAFYNNLTLELLFGVESRELDGAIAYSNPLSRRSLLNRYRLLLRKNEGRLEADARLSLNGSRGILSQTNGRQLHLGLNYSSLLNAAYTFREVKSDTGTFQFDEWQDTDVLLGYADFRAGVGSHRLESESRLRVEAGLPGGDAEFVKVSGRLTNQLRGAGLQLTVRGNGGTSFGPDRLPLQDQFRAEGAGARERFQHDILKTGEALTGFSRRFVEGGGFLRGYVGQPLPAERFVSINVELGPAAPWLGLLRPFAFYDAGRVWRTRADPAANLADAGFGVSVFGDDLKLFGGNTSLFGDFSAKLIFPIWLSDPLPGQARRQFRWYFTLGRQL